MLHSVIYDKQKLTRLTKRGAANMQLAHLNAIEESFALARRLLSYTAGRETNMSEKQKTGMQLLTIGNAKTTLGESLDVLTGILYLSPEVSPKLCPYASEECKALCLVNSGRAEIFPLVNEARARKTHWYLTDRASFILQLKKDIRLLEKRAAKRGMRCAVRLNGTSDIVWERLLDFAEFPNVQFYDYTKIPLRYRSVAINYHLTFSFSGHNWDECKNALDNGVNVAVVFDKAIPDTYRGYAVLDGTLHDVRFMDKLRGAIVGLCAKGKRAKKAARENSTFIIKA